MLGCATGRKSAANKELATRVQTSTEYYVSYSRDVLALCRKADRDMTESYKVGHVLKQIADYVFNLLMHKHCETVQDTIKVSAL